MNKEDIKEYLNFLNHKDYDIRAFTPQKTELKKEINMGGQWFRDKKEILKFCKKYDKKANIYASVLPKDGKEKGKDGVIKVDKLWIEIDAKRDKGSASSEESVKEAKNVMEKIRNDLRNKYGLPFVVMSGNGYHLIWEIKPIEVTNENREKLNRKMKLFVKKMKTEFEEGDVDIDTTVGDIARILKIPGTTSVKGRKKHWRQSKIVYENSQTEEQKEKLKEDFLLLETKTTNTKKELKEIDKEELNKDPVLNALLDSEYIIRDGTGGNSVFLKNYAVRFVQVGLSDNEIRDGVGKALVDHLENRNLEMLMGWVSKARRGKITEFNKKEINKTIEEYDHDLPKYKTLKAIPPSNIDASVVDREILLNGRIVGEKTKKVLPKKVKVWCTICGEEIIHDVREEPARFIFKGRREIIKVLNSLKKKLECGCSENSKEDPRKFKVLEKMDYSVIYVSNLLEETDKFSTRASKPITVHVIDAKLPEAKKVKINGYVTSHPVSNDLVVVGQGITPLESEATNFKITEEDKKNFKKYFKEKNNSEILNQTAPDMIGRPLVQKARLLVLHSPHSIPNIDKTKEIRGCLREILIGDTKTYKSESIKDVTRNHYLIGGYCTAETGSRTGLVYTIDNDKKTIIWGQLPLNDLGYVGIDGLNALHQEEMTELREILEGQRVTVRRSQSGDALARVRISGAMNPGRKKNPPMNNYLYKCKSILDTYIFQSTPDITRWDLFIPFCDDDVPSHLIVNRKTSKRPIPDDIFIRHIYWAWSRKPENIEYTKKAKEKIKRDSERLIEEYHNSKIPIVHRGTRAVVTRLSVAQACLNHNTDKNHEKVIVEKIDVEDVVNFYEKVLEKLELKEFKEKWEGKLEITESEFGEIIEELSKRQLKILEKIEESKSSKELADLFDVSERTIKNDYKLLKKCELIKTITGQGVSLTTRGVKFLRILRASEEKLHYFTPKLRTTHSKNDKNQGGNAQNLSEIVKKNFTKGDKNNKKREKNVNLQQKVLSCYPEPNKKPKKYYEIEEKAEKKGINPIDFSEIHENLNFKGQIFQTKGGWKRC